MPDPAERLTVAPEAPPSDAPRASTVQSIDPAPPTPSREPAPAMPPPDRAVQLVDKLGELVGVILLGWLAHGRVIDGTLGAVLICAVLGVNTGLRQIGARAVGAGHGLGVVGLVVAGASGYGAHVVHGARALFTGLVAALVVLALGCTSGPRSPNDTATQVVKVATLTGATAWVSRAATRYFNRRTYALDTAALRDTARAVVSDLQVSVERAKDPSHPDATWTPELAASVRLEAVRRVRALSPLAVRTVLTALDGDAHALDALIGAYVEDAVRALRPARS